MSRKIDIKRGLDIPIPGKAPLEVKEAKQTTFAVKPVDFFGVERPKVLVEQGDTVKAGTPLYFNRQLEKVKHTAPVSGEVVEIVRGYKRRLERIVILKDRKIEYEPFPKYSISEMGRLERETIVNALCDSGLWCHLIQRPFGIIADPQTKPDAIFISCFDSHPLAPDMTFLLEGQDRNFQVGIDAISRLTEGNIHVSVHADHETSRIFNSHPRARVHRFTGPHPSGNVGVQIHHIAAAHKDKVVWTLSPQGVVQIGKLFLRGVYDASRRVALTGPGVLDPRYVETFTGACLSDLLADEQHDDGKRYIAGNVLTGENAGYRGYLGFFHNQLTVIAENREEEFLGWIKPGYSKFSIHRAIGLFSFLFPRANHDFNTSMFGERRPFVLTGVYEKVLPMDIHPLFLFKAILAEDYEEMESLGIYELIEEDVALLEYVDVSKQDLQAILREGLNFIQNN